MVMLKVFHTKNDIGETRDNNKGQYKLFKKCPQQCIIYFDSYNFFFIVNFCQNFKVIQELVNVAFT